MLRGARPLDMLSSGLAESGAGSMASTKAVPRHLAASQAYQYCFDSPNCAVFYLSAFDGIIRRVRKAGVNHTLGLNRIGLAELM